MMPIPVDIIRVNDTVGIAYPRVMALALLAATPVVAPSLIFQKRVTEAAMISDGFKS